jgi:Leucine-rich repeat (LRR) protein
MNTVQHIPQELFQGTRKLTVIHLSGNSLEDLPEQIFQDLEHLEELDLSNNVLTDIRPGVFKGNLTTSHITVT